jgi:putative flippase GtrA
MRAAFRLPGELYGLAAWRPPLMIKARSVLGFSMVGASGVAVNLLLLWLLVNLVHMQYLVAAALATSVSTTSNFVLTEFGVFGSRRQKGIVVRYLSFGALSLASLPVRLPLMFLLTSILAMHYLLSNLVSLGMIFLARFVVSDQLIWGKR